MHGFLGAELGDRCKQGDHICGDVAVASEGSREKSVCVCVFVFLFVCVCWKVKDSIYKADH